jgi:hypothetical protein
MPKTVYFVKSLRKSVTFGALDGFEQGILREFSNLSRDGVLTY